MHHKTHLDCDFYFVVESEGLFKLTKVVISQKQFQTEML